MYVGVRMFALICLCVSDSITLVYMCMCSKSVAPGMCMYTSFPRSLSVHVTHQSAVCSPQWGSGGWAEECSLCAILGHTSCSGSVTTAVHGCAFDWFTCMDCGCRRVYVSVCVCLSVYLHSADAHVSWLPTSEQRPLACNCKWMAPLWESKPIYCPRNSTINGQPLAGVLSLFDIVQPL